jgi:PrcB C-terminal
MPRVPWWLACFSLLMGFGCLGPDATRTQTTAEFPVAVISSGAICGGASGPCLEWITDKSRLIEAAEQALRTFSVKPPAVPPRVDFKAFGVLGISMGEKPTGGYELALAGPAGRIRDNTLIIRLDWIEPEPDAMVIQMITRPCLLLKVPLGDFRHVEIRDQHGTLRCRLDIQP